MRNYSLTKLSLILLIQRTFYIFNQALITMHAPCGNKHNEIFRGKIKWIYFENNGTIVIDVLEDSSCNQILFIVLRSLPQVPHCQSLYVYRVYHF